MAVISGVVKTCLSKTEIWPPRPRQDRDFGVGDQDQASETKTQDIRDWDLQCKSCVESLKGIGEMKLHINTWFYLGRKL